MLEYEKIWKKILAPDEEVKYEFSIGKKYRLVCTILGVTAGVVLLLSSALLVGVVVITISILYYWFYLKIANAYAFTNKRILIFRGWLSTELISIDYDKITDIIVEEPFFPKVFTQTGHLIIKTAGAGFLEFKKSQKLAHIEKPYEVKKKLDELRSPDAQNKP